MRIHLGWLPFDSEEFKKRLRRGKRRREGESDRKATRRLFEQASVPYAVLESLAGGLPIRTAVCTPSVKAQENSLPEGQATEDDEIDHRCAEWGRELGEEIFHPRVCIARQFLGLYSLCALPLSPASHTVHPVRTHLEMRLLSIPSSRRSDDVAARSSRRGARDKKRRDK